MPGALFVSHASADEATVKEIVKYLEARSVRCWLASRDIPPGTLYAEAIGQAIQQSSACAVIVSAAADSSDAVKRELELASHYRKPFVPIRIDTWDVGPSFNYYLRNTQWIDFSRHGASALQRVVDDIQALAPASNQQSVTGREPLTSSQPERSDASPPRVAMTPKGQAAKLPGYAIPLLIVASAVGLLALLWSMNSTPRHVGYPPQTEVTFKSHCEASEASPAQQAYCACTWEKIEAEIDPNSFAALEQLPTSEREAHPLMQQIRGYMLACRGTPPVEQPPAP